MRMLNVVDEEGKIVRTESREEIHKQGLLHQEINVWFYTPDGQIIFQHRAPDKDTYPNLYDATVGGHVEIGQSYEEAAVQEVREETGIEVSIEELRFLRTVILKSFDKSTGMTNHPRRNVYAYRYAGSINDLHIEEGKALGFVAYQIEDLFSLPDLEKQKFIPTLLDEQGLQVFKDIKNLL